MKKNTPFLLLAFSCLLFTSNPISFAQSFQFTFENCDVSSSIGNGSFVGNPNCVCGLTDNSVFLDGANDGIILPDSILTYLKDEFTIDMYVSNINTGTDQIDIFSIGNDCGFDSLITVKRLLDGNQILVELINNNGEYYSLRKPWPDKCWNRITLVKFKLNYILYLNNVEVGRSIVTQNIPIPINSKFSISNSPCLALADSRFRGKVDEITIYNKALTERDILNTYLFPDELITQDTTIFLGGSVDIEFGLSCSNSFSWSPTTDLSASNEANVTATPTETTTYILTSNDNGCITKNEVTINVVDPSKIECQNLLLPNAFTPNGDRLNDTYGISNTFIIDVLENFEILNRWGEVLYRSNDKNTGWDGTFKSAPVEPGVYVYKIKYTCKTEEFNKSGNFVVLK